MELHGPTLLMGALLLATLAGGLTTLVGALVRVYRGYGLWVAAQWVLVVATALAVSSQAHQAAGAAAQLGLLLWPMLVLMGLRRLQARKPIRGSAQGDLTLLAAAAALLLSLYLAFDGATESTAFAACAALAHGYAGWRAFATPSAQSNLGHRLLAWLLCATAAAHGLVLAGAALAWPDPMPWLHAVWAVQVAAALALVQLALLASTERTVAELRDSRRRLRFLANIDMLTQVPNRRHFGELARQVLARQEHPAAAVLMFDIDHFKRINDELGHAAGDRALRVVSQCVQGTLRGQDVAGRHGGDEFVLLLPETSMRDAMAVATRIVTRAQQMAQEQAIPQLSLSFGVVQMGSDESLDEAMRRADQALYEAKRQGRGRAVSAAGDERAPVFVESRRLGLVAP